MTKVLFAIFALVLSTSAAAQLWNNSPNNWQNSANNWHNSSNNWQNSPNNWQNSRNNPSRQNGIYDSSGNSVGYFTRSPSGTVNLYTNDGTRYGYSR